MDYENSMIGGTPYDGEIEDFCNPSMDEIAEKLNISYNDVKRGYIKTSVNFSLTEASVFVKFHYDSANECFVINALSCSIDGVKLDNEKRFDLKYAIELELIEAYERECKKNPNIAFWKNINKIMGV